MTAQQPLFASTWTYRGRVGTSSAVFSEDRRYRYELRRTWDATRRPLVVVACNPSKAGETRDDSTCRRLYSFASAWGLGGVVLLNAFAFCATDPKVLRAAAKSGVDVIGVANNATIERVLAAHREDRLLLAWGGNGKLLDRGPKVAAIALALHGRPECFGLTADGHPSHVLYLPDASVPHVYADLVRRRQEAA